MYIHVNVPGWWDDEILLSLIEEVWTHKTTFYCTKPWKWAGHVFVLGIDFVSCYDFAIRFWTCYDSVVFLFFTYYIYMYIHPPPLAHTPVLIATKNHTAMWHIYCGSSLALHALIVSYPAYGISGRLNSVLVFWLDKLYHRQRKWQRLSNHISYLVQIWHQT